MYQGLYSMFVLCIITVCISPIKTKPLSMNRIDFIMLYIHKKKNQSRDEVTIKQLNVFAYITAA